MVFKVRGGGDEFMEGGGGISGVGVSGSCVTSESAASDRLDLLLRLVSSLSEIDEMEFSSFASRPLLFPAPLFGAECPGG